MLTKRTIVGFENILEKEVPQFMATECQQIRMNFPHQLRRGDELANYESIRV